MPVLVYCDRCGVHIGEEACQEAGRPDGRDLCAECRPKEPVTCGGCRQRLSDASIRRATFEQDRGWLCAPCTRRGSIRGKRRRSQLTGGFVGILGVLGLLIAWHSLSQTGNSPVASPVLAKGREAALTTQPPESAMAGQTERELSEPEAAALGDEPAPSNQDPPSVLDPEPPAPPPTPKVRPDRGPATLAYLQRMAELLRETPEQVDLGDPPPPQSMWQVYFRVAALEELLRPLQMDEDGVDPQLFDFNLALFGLCHHALKTFDPNYRRSEAEAALLRKTAPIPTRARGQGLNSRFAQGLATFLVGSGATQHAQLMEVLAAQDALEHRWNILTSVLIERYPSQEPELAECIGPPFYTRYSDSLLTSELPEGMAHASLETNRTTMQLLLQAWAEDDTALSSWAYVVDPNEHDVLRTHRHLVARLLELGEQGLYPELLPAIRPAFAIAQERIALFRELVGKTVPAEQRARVPRRDGAIDYDAVEARSRAFIEDRLPEWQAALERLKARLPVEAAALEAIHRECVGE